MSGGKYNNAKDMITDVCFFFTSCVKEIADKKSKAARHMCVLASTKRALICVPNNKLTNKMY